MPLPYNINTMKSILLTIALIFSITHCFAQKKDFMSKAGIKLGYNINRLAGQSVDLRFRNKSGFMIAGYFSPSTKGLGYRTELVFSRQGFSYDDNGTRQDVQTDYLYLPQFTTFSIGNVFQLQVGGQIGYLLKSSATPKGSSSGDDVTEFMNRLDYGAAFGFEVYPIKRLIIGSRYNMSFGNLYEQDPSAMASPFPFMPSDVKGRNAVLQFFVGVKL